MGTLLFKANYKYKLIMLLILDKLKKNLKRKGKVEELINLYKDFYKIVKLI